MTITPPFFIAPRFQQITMANLESIAHEVKKLYSAAKVARTVYDFAYKAKADKETQDFLWEKYHALVTKKEALNTILEQLGTATIELQKAIEWSSTGVYASYILDTIKRTHPNSSDTTRMAYHQLLIDKAIEQQLIASAEVTRLSDKAKPYLSI